MGAPTEMITVYLGPEYANVTVFSSEKYGELIDSSTTTADGKAVLLARSGGMVSFPQYGFQLMTFLNIDTDEGIVWQESSPSIVAGGQSVTVESAEVIGGERYEIYACRDFAFEYEAPLSVDLRLSEACLEPATFSVIGFVSDYDGVMAYAHATADSLTGFQDPIALEWLTDFEEVPVVFDYPGLTAQVRVSPALEYGPLFLRVPPHEVDLVDSAYKKPPGDADLLWVDLTAFGPALGWQDYRGPLPTSKSDWLRVPNGAVIRHSQASAPVAEWITTKEGDLVAGSYLWDSDSGIGSWQFVGSPVERYAPFPQLPPELTVDFNVGVDPTFGSLSIDVIDYKDIDGYQAAIDAGRASWPFSYAGAEGYLREGGAIASATTYAYL